MKVLVIPWDGPAHTRELADDGNKLREMQAVVGGLIEAIDLELFPPPAGQGVPVMWANEEGLYACADQRNDLAIHVRNQYNPAHGRWNPVLLGNVFVSGFRPSDGESIDVPDGVIEYVNAIAGVRVGSVDGALL